MFWTAASIWYRWKEEEREKRVEGNMEWRKEEWEVGGRRETVIYWNPWPLSLGHQVFRNLETSSPPRRIFSISNIQMEI